MPELNDKMTVACAGSLPRGVRTRLVVLAVAFAFAFAHTAPFLLNTWSYPDFSHGIIVPFVSLYLVWVRREALKDLPFEPSYFYGIPVVLAGAALLILGSTGSVVVVEETSVIVMVPGLVLLLFGKRYLKALALPVGYLVLMVPVLTPFLEAIYWPLQLVTAKLAGMMLSLSGVPVFQSGQFIDLPNISLEVAEACSGAQFLVSVLAIAIPLAYLSLKTASARAALFALSVLITIAANSLRVTLIGYLAYVYDKKTALHGPYHILTGYFVFMVGFFFLFLSAWALSRVFSPAAPQRRASVKDAWQGPGNRDRTENERSFQTAWVLSLAVLLSLGAFVQTYRPVPVPLRESIAEIPLSIDSWVGESIIHDADPLKVPGADFETSRIYKNAEGKVLKLYVGYLMYQKQDKELIHVHFSGLYDKIKQVEVALGDGASIRINKAVMREGGKDFLVLFWYDLSGRVVADRYEAKFLSAVNGLVHRRTNGAVVIIKSEIGETGGTQKVLADAEGFIRALVPVLKNYLPQA